MADWQNRMLSFLAVGRVKDSTVLASYVNESLDPEGKTKDIFQKLLAAAAVKLSAGQRTRLQWGDGSVCCLMDGKGENLYCVVTALLSYPERLAYELLYALQKAADEQDLVGAPAGGLQDSLGPQMKDMVTHYEDAKNFPQFAIAMTGSRTSLDTSQPAVVPSEGGGSGAKILIAVVVLLLVAGAVYWFFLRTPAENETPGRVAGAPSNFLAPRIASVEEAGLQWF